jgi:hypothetical protein
LLARKIFHLAIVPDPIVQLGIVKDSFAHISDILAYPAARVILPGCYYKAQIRIISFNIRVIPARGTAIDLGTATGPDLSAEQQTYIRSLQPGSKIILEHTKFIAAGGCPRSLNAITIRVR